MNLRLRRVQRVRTPHQFKSIIKNGKFFKGVFLNLWAVRVQSGTREAMSPALGVMVSRRTDKRATRRNLWKRRIRETFRRNQNGVDKNWAVVIQSRCQPEVPTYFEIEAELIRLLRKAGCWKE